jgi:hypothetical protein
MTHQRLGYLLGALLGLLIALPAGAADVTPTPASSADRQSVMQACPRPAPPAATLAETSQTDCCKGHKGVCGCRAGKIVCCDGTTSANCTCHGDDGLPN